MQGEEKSLEPLILKREVMKYLQLEQNEAVRLSKKADNFREQIMFGLIARYIGQMIKSIDEMPICCKKRR